MLIRVNQSVEIIATHKRGGPAKLMPRIMEWNNRVYKFSRLGFHHVTSKGKKLIHVFSVTDETSTFRLEFDTENLSWTLAEIADGLPS
jgi:hypothetical protein